MIDDLPFPFLRDYDLNLWVDDDQYLRVRAYRLCLSEVKSTDENGEPTTIWQIDNHSCGEAISVLTVHYDDYNEPDRDAIFGDLYEDWIALDEFTGEGGQYWADKYPQFYSLVCEHLRLDLATLSISDIRWYPYEACLHPIDSTD